MTKRKDILREIRKHAQQTEQSIKIEEGSNHTKIWVGNHYTTLPRHNEIPNHFAKKILKDIGI